MQCFLVPFGERVEGSFPRRYMGGRDNALDSLDIIAVSPLKLSRLLSYA